MQEHYKSEEATGLQMSTILFICVTLFLPIRAATQDAEPKRPWAPALYDALKARDSVISTLRNMRRGVTVEKMRRVMESLDELPTKIEGLDNLDVSMIETDITLMGNLLKHTDRPEGRKLFRSDNLENDYNRELAQMIKAFKGYHNFRCIQALYSSPESLQGFNFPIEYMCFKVQDKVSRPNTYTFSTDKICHTVKRCTGRERPYPYDSDEDATSVQDACLGDGNHCDVEEALPMMGSLLWYRVSKFMARSLCRDNLKQPDKSILSQEFSEIQEMVRMVMAFASTINWDLFFAEAINRRAYSNLEVALGLVTEYEKSFSSSPVACYKLEADDVCIYSDINKEYQSVRKTQQLRLHPGETRNLRPFERVNHAKMVELKRRALDHIDVLGNIKSVDENLGEATAGIKSYLRGLAEYDQGIADQDVAFLSGKLTDFESRADDLSEKLEQNVRNTLIAANTILALQLTDEIDTLANQIAEHMNPLKCVFGGVDVGDMLEQAGKIAKAVAEVAQGARLLDRLDELYCKSYDLTKKFKDNADQISNLQIVINTIKANSVDQIGYDADKFVEDYGSYTPKVNRSDLERNDALWGAYKESACNLLYGAEGAFAGVGQAVESGMLLCEKLEGTLAEFTALRENIFDFQFDLVDSFAKVVRGNTAKKLTQSIEDPNAPLKSSQLMLGYFMTQNALQLSASLYCDKLEYTNQGKKVSVCTPRTGLFARGDLDELIAYKADTTYHLDERFVYLPTRAQFRGDTGFVNWQLLAEGKPITFRLPANRTWLRQYNWLAPDETTAPFVQSFKLYLPHKTYGGSEERYSKTRVRLTSIAGSAVSTESDVVYYLPLEHSHYLTAYSEGFNPSRCPNGRETANPYSLCKNLPNICDTITRIPGTSIMPTTLSTWRLSYVIESSTEELDWDAPDPATNLLVIARVKLRYPSLQNGKRSRIHIKDTPPPGCCTDNEYRPDWNDETCVSCPVKPAVGADSESYLGGYYCEKGIVEGTIPSNG